MYTSSGDSSKCFLSAWCFYVVAPLRELKVAARKSRALGVLGFSIPHVPQISKALARHPRQLEKLAVHISGRSRSR